MKKFAVIVAGGSGSRMKTNIPKQFITLEGRPILMHTIDLFYTYDPTITIIVVLPEQEVKTWEKLCIEKSYKVKHAICTGGENRFFSVKNGLSQISGEGIVFIHDGVRPLASSETLERCYNMAFEKGNATPVIPIAESMRRVEGEKNKEVDRSKYFLVQTPQTFQTSIIKKAFHQEYSPRFTDDASILEAAGREINLVEGNRENIKITYPEDILQAEFIFLSRKARQ